MKIINPANKQELTFLKRAKDTNGQLLEMESLYQPNSLEPPPHYHPHQKETFRMLEGEMQVRIHGEVRTLKTGEVLVIEPNTVHSMWNAADTIARVNWKTEPALRTEEFFRNLFGLAADGKTNAGGTPGLLQLSLIAPRYADEFRLAKPPLVVQKVLFGVLGPVAKLKGLKASYNEYLRDK